MDENTKDIEINQQAIVEITIGSILSSIVNSIVGFIAVYFFKPIWDKIVIYWNKHD